MNDDADSGVLILAKQGSITFIGNVFGKVLGFAFVVVATRLVPPAEYGIFTLGLSIVLFAQGFTSLNVYRSIDYFVPKFLSEEDHGRAKRTLQNAFTIGTAASIIGAVSIFLARKQIATLFHEPQLAVVLPLFVLLIPTQTINRSLLASFNSIKKMEYRVAVRDIINPLTRTLGAIVFVSAGWGLIGLVGGYLIGITVAVLCGVVLLIWEADWIQNTTATTISNYDLLSYSLPLVLAGVIYSLVGQVDYFVIGYFLNSADVGQYRVAYLLASNLLIVLTAITPVFKPMVAENSSNNAILEQRYQLATRWVIMLTLPLTITLVLAPDIFLSLLFTTEYSQASTAVVALTVGYFLNASFGPEGMMLEGLGNTRLTLVNTFILVGTNGLLDILLVPKFGILGAGIATGSALALAGFVGVLEIYFLRSIHPFSLRLVRVGIAAILPLVAGRILVEFLTGLVQVIFFLPLLVAVIYVVSLRITNAFTEDDLAIASRIDARLGFPLFRPIINSTES